MRVAMRLAGFGLILALIFAAAYAVGSATRPRSLDRHVEQPQTAAAVGEVGG